MLDRTTTRRRSASWLRAAALLVASSTASAQSYIGTGFFEWQVSADGGQTWQAGDVVVPSAQQFVSVRAFVGWSSDAGFAFTGAWFDVTVTGSGGVGAGDVVDSFSRGRMTSGSNQTIVPQRFGDVLKIDDSRDTLAPGQGPRGVFPGQLTPQFWSPEFTTANPVMVFTFRLSLDGTLGRRDIASLFIAPTNGNSVDRFLRTYMPFGGINQPLMTFAPASVTVIPAPAAVGVMFGVLAVGRRRRSSGVSRRT
jgi:hypothetical protein